MEFLPENKHRI